MINRLYKVREINLFGFYDWYYMFGGIKECEFLYGVDFMKYITDNASTLNIHRFKEAVSEQMSAAGIHWGDHHFNDATIAAILYNTIKSMEDKTK